MSSLPFLFNSFPCLLKTGNRGRLISKASGFSATAAMSIICSVALPSKASTFLDLSTWTGAINCNEEITARCVSQELPDYDYTILGEEGQASADYIITSPIYSAQAFTYVKFNYSFSGTNSDRRAFYNAGSGYQEIYPGTSSIGGIYLPANTSFSFKLTSVDGQKPGLGVSNFEGVPAPVPLFGAAAAFGAIRRRRAALRKAAAGQAVASRD